SPASRPRRGRRIFRASCAASGSGFRSTSKAPGDNGPRARPARPAIRFRAGPGPRPAIPPQPVRSWRGHRRRIDAYFDVVAVGVAEKNLVIAAGADLAVVFDAVGSK